MKEYILCNPVFKITHAWDCGERKTVAHACYIRIRPTTSGATAISQLRNELAARYKVDIRNVTFMMWADSVVTTGGSPQEIEP